MAPASKKSFLSSLIPFAFLSLGTYFAFAKFWNGFDSITGDLGDSRFNMIIFEHTWLWLKGAHASLFDIPMFFPYANTYAYSDYLMGYAPIYWLLRSLSLDPHFSIQFWLVICGVLNFVSYFFLTKRFFQLSVFWSSFAAYLFSFGVPRVAHLYHVQTFPQFYIVISVFGLLLWKEKPESKLAPWLFLTGGMLQFISAFYYLWFWVLILFFYSMWIMKSAERRSRFIGFFKKINRPHLFASLTFNVIFAIPFLIHYALNSKEIGRHGWVPISETVPRFYSWLFISKDHWQWAITPFKGFISELARPVEQNVSLGLITWAGCLLSIHWIWKKRTDLKFLVIPFFAIFIFTLTSGRFSTWVLISYLFPAGGAIRAVGRIQIFLLMLWALIFTLYLVELARSNQRTKRLLAFILAMGALSETIYTNSMTYSRKQSTERIQFVSNQISPECDLAITPSALGPYRPQANIDAVLAAFQKGIPTMNGYSGHDPKSYPETMGNLPNLVHHRKICLLNEFKADI